MEDQTGHSTLLVIHSYCMRTIVWCVMAEETSQHILWEYTFVDRHRFGHCGTMQLELTQLVKALDNLQSV